MFEIISGALFILFWASLLYWLWAKKPRGRVAAAIYDDLKAVARPAVEGQCVLSRSMKMPQLKDIKLGQFVYAVPWAMFADSKGVLWLDSSASYGGEPYGTQAMKVTRTLKGVEVDISLCKDHGWLKGGGRRGAGIPVMKLIK